ncbi:MAG: TiaS agmantine-binding domain-containing protein [Candidatus Heimdallarchaeaceae archaeon]
MVFLQGNVPKFIEQFSIKVLTDIVSIQTTKKILEEHHINHYYIGNGRGLTGALAAVGNTLNPLFEDFTYELLSYRKKKNVGTKRQVDEDSVKKMDETLKPFVFNNIDEESNKSLISPAGKDPVLYGIRGESPTILLTAMKKVQVGEEIESYCIFRTNQGTDQHFKYANSNIKNYNVFKGRLSIISKSKTIIGGHVFLRGKVEGTSKEVDIAAFEPSKEFRKVIRSLQEGDQIFAYGGIRFRKESGSFAVQLEKCEIEVLAEKFKEEAPFCPICKKRMVSDGKDKGYKCRNCKYKDKTLRKTKIPIQRVIQKGVYIPPAQAQRHLVKPHRRYGLKRKEKIEFVENWWKVF